MPRTRPFKLKLVKSEPDSIMPGFTIRAVNERGEVVGSVRVVNGDRPGTVRMVNAFTPKEYRNSGIGTTLLRQAEAEARRRGAKRVKLEVRQKGPEASKGFFAKRGYRTTGMGDERGVPVTRMSKRLGPKPRPQGKKSGRTRMPR